MMPTVTQVLSTWADFSGIPPETLAAAADRGTRVHRACAAMIRGCWPVVGDDIRGYLDSFKAWFELVVDEVIASEITLEDKFHGYTGTPDLICRIKGDDGLAVVDLKTPAAEARSWRLQLAAYRNLAQLHYSPLPVNRVLVLRLRGEGYPALVSDYSPTMHQDFAVFINCLCAWRWFND